MPTSMTSAGSASSLVRLRVAAGLDATEERDLSPRLQRLIAVARDVGAPMAEAIDAGLAAEEDQRRAERAIDVASSQSRVVAGGLLVAPLALVPGLGRLLDVDLIAFYRSTSGVLVLLAGLGLLSLGALLVVGLLRRVRRPPSAAGGRARRVGIVAAVGLLTWWLGGPVIALPAATIAGMAAGGSRTPADPAHLEEAVELTATALTGGVSQPQALRFAAEQLSDLARPLHRLAFDLEVGTGHPSGHPSGRTSAHPSGHLTVGPAPDPSALERLAAVLAAANDLGAPVAPTLRRFAAELRADELARVLAAAERLPAQLTFPTALCLLPGTVLLVGAPIVQAGLAAVGT